ncbi:MAG: outer membrane lipoprotein carrier protein LolA [Candidatus Cloacimonetes bacterium]|nr:outer membrane lipoprotein carrier protein LolA [Candidatus Cloacimonadota bacterium]
MQKKRILKDMGYRKLLIIVLLATVSLIKGISIDDTYIRVKSAYDNIENFQADLVQKNVFKAEKMEIESKAKFFYQPSRIKISYSEPQEQVILMNGLEVKFYDIESNTCVVMSDNDNSLQLNPIYVIDKYWKYSDKKIKEERKAIILQLRPLQEDDFKNIVITIDSNSYFINKISYEDATGNRVDINFTNIDIESTIPVDTWKLNLPKDVNYIKR